MRECRGLPPGSNPVAMRAKLRPFLRHNLMKRAEYQFHIQVSDLLGEKQHQLPNLMWSEPEFG